MIRIRSMSFPWLYISVRFHINSVHHPHNKHHFQLSARGGASGRAVVRTFVGNPVYRYPDVSRPRDQVLKGYCRTRRRLGQCHDLTCRVDHRGKQSFGRCWDPGHHGNRRVSLRGLLIPVLALGRLEDVHRVELLWDKCYHSTHRAERHRCPQCPLLSLGIRQRSGKSLIQPSISDGIL